jgi:hypothetical protein
MARPERETKTYITWLPFLIDSLRWISQGWHIIEKERIPPKWKILAPLSFVFPILRVTYQRIVAGGMLPPDERREAFRLASRMSNDPRYANDPQYAAFLLLHLETPLPPGSSPGQADPSKGEPVLPTPVSTEVRVPESQQETASESSLLPPPPPKRPREGI